MWGYKNDLFHHPLCGVMLRIMYHQPLCRVMLRIKYHYPLCGVLWRIMYRHPLCGVMLRIICYHPLIRLCSTTHYMGSCFTIYQLQSHHIFFSVLWLMYHGISWYLDMTISSILDFYIYMPLSISHSNASFIMSLLYYMPPYLVHSKRLIHTLCQHYITMQMQVILSFMLVARSKLLDDSNWLNPHTLRTRAIILSFMICVCIRDIFSLCSEWARTYLSLHLMSQVRSIFLKLCIWFNFRIVYSYVMIVLTLWVMISICFHLWILLFFFTLNVV